jgi:hypothetical protein
MIFVDFAQRPFEIRLEHILNLDGNKHVKVWMIGKGEVLE